MKQEKAENDEEETNKYQVNGQRTTEMKRKKLYICTYIFLNDLKIIFFLSPVLNARNAHFLRNDFHLKYDHTIIMRITSGEEEKKKIRKQKQSTHNTKTCPMKSVKSQK